MEPDHHFLRAKILLETDRMKGVYLLLHCCGSQEHSNIGLLAWKQMEIEQRPFFSQQGWKIATMYNRAKLTANSNSKQQQLTVICFSPLGKKKITFSRNLPKSVFGLFQPFCGLEVLPKIWYQKQIMYRLIYYNKSLKNNFNNGWYSSFFMHLLIQSLHKPTAHLLY